MLHKSQIKFVTCMSLAIEIILLISWSLCIDISRFQINLPDSDEDSDNWEESSVSLKYMHDLSA